MSLSKSPNFVKTEVEIFFMDDVKSAVQGLLEEIESTKFATSKHLQDAVREEIKNLIEKWLHDVVVEWER